MSRFSVVYEMLKSKYGGHLDHWVINHKRILKFVEHNKIRPIEREHFVFDDPVPVVPMAGTKESIEAVPIRPFPPFPGGLKCAHLHCRGDVFLLTDVQWREFSGAVIKDFQTKLDAVETVGFDQLMELSKAIGGLG